MTNPMDHGRRSVLICFRLNGAILFMRWDRGRRRLLHQVGQRRTRGTPFPTQTCPHTRAIFGWAILAQLPLPVDLFDRKLEPNDPADHLLEKFTRRVLDSPRTSAGSDRTQARLAEEILAKKVLPEFRSNPS